MAGNGTIEFDPDRESPERPREIYAGSGKDLEYAFGKAADDALEKGRQPGDRLDVVRWEVVIGNGHVSDHIVYLSFSPPG